MVVDLYLTTFLYDNRQLVRVAYCRIRMFAYLIYS